MIKFFATFINATFYIIILCIISAKNRKRLKYRSFKQTSANI